MSGSHISLAILSNLYRSIVATRNILYDRGILSTYRASIPVIGVGNLTAGGNGKTPLAMHLASHLSGAGYRPVILSRGYGGRLRGPICVEAHHSWREVGDEPKLMAESLGLPVVVSRDRREGARFIERSDTGDVIVLDDGFQHRRLARTVDIITVNVGSEEAVRDFIEGKLLPLGTFREPRDSGLRRAHYVIFSERRPKRSENSGVLQSLIPSNIETYRSSIDQTSVTSLITRETLTEKNIVGFCALANPEPFFATLEDLGYEVQARESFPDHHPYSPGDLSRLTEKYRDIPLVCTEKDALKLKEFAPAIVFVCRASLSIESHDKFFASLLRRLEDAVK